ncbi:MAG: ABC transporter substrate-binding protein [Bacteroidales bacterium]|nr:ABC transporter substrate-binding protein [Bacteroidales bacterium]
MRRSRHKTAPGLILALLLAVACWPARAQEVITFMPQWTPQTQFAGYYVAVEKGFYAEEGLDVIIDHFGGSSTESVVDKLARKKVDVITTQLVSALLARDKGLKLVNVLQTTQVNGLMCATNFPIESPQSLEGKKIGRWKVGFGEVSDMFCYRNGLTVEWIPYLQGINMFVSGAVDALLCYSFSEYLQLVLATGGIAEDHVIRFRDFGLDFPEDGLYVTEDYYKKNKDVVDKFVRASRKGWDYARQHPDEALDISMDFIRDFNVATSRTLQRMMLEEMLKLQVNPLTGVADYAPVSREVFESLNASLREMGYMSHAIKYEEMIR